MSAQRRESRQLGSRPKEGEKRGRTGTFSCLDPGDTAPSVSSPMSVDGVLVRICWMNVLKVVRHSLTKASYEESSWDDIGKG